MSSNEKRVPHLYSWYIEKKQSRNGTEFMWAYGCVTGHKKLPDTMFIHTSKIVHVEVKEETEEVVIQTLNTEYHCMLSDCDLKQPDTYAVIPDLARYAEKHDRKREYALEDNSILLILSDHCMYYFEAMRIRKNGKTYEGSMHAHIGMLQDSCLVGSWEYLEANSLEDRIDIRYFPHQQHLETYTWETGGLPVYLENAGDSVLYYTVHEGVMELKPGERKLVSKENVMADAEVPVLGRGDLYPAAGMDASAEMLNMILASAAGFGDNAPD